MKKWLGPIVAIFALLLNGCGAIGNTVMEKPTKIKVLIIDGQNNHGIWPKSTMMMKRDLEQAQLFTVDVLRTENTWNGAQHLKKYPLNDGKKYKILKKPVADANFAPNFEDYDVVISNFGWKAADWPQSTKIAFENYMKNGGGLVVVHAADNSFGNWVEYNKMIGVGGWGGRNEKSGPFLYFEGDKLIRDTSPGGGGMHGPKHEFVVQNRAKNHPIMAGIPTKWLHTKDELYAKLRGPAENLTVLASAYDKNKSKKNEPVLMTINYHQGRVFHTTLGHDATAFSSVGFITTLLRGTEWAATGKVTIPVPADFPTENKTSQRPFK